MKSERLFNSFIPSPPKKLLYPPKQISGYATDTVYLHVSDNKLLYTVQVHLKLSDQFTLTLNTMYWKNLQCASEKNYSNYVLHLKWEIDL